MPDQPPLSSPSSADSPVPDLPGWAKRLHRLGLAGIAGTLIEAGAPLAPIIGQILYVAQPTLGLFVPRQSIGHWAEWLDQPKNLSALVSELDQLSNPPDTKDR